MLCVRAHCLCLQLHNYRQKVWHPCEMSFGCVTWTMEQMPLHLLWMTLHRHQKQQIHACNMAQQWPRSVCCRSLLPLSQYPSTTGDASCKHMHDAATCVQQPGTEFSELMHHNLYARAHSITSLFRMGSHQDHRVSHSCSMLSHEHVASVWLMILSTA